MDNHNYESWTQQTKTNNLITTRYSDIIDNETGQSLGSCSPPPVTSEYKIFCKSKMDANL